jgi:CheY-specific phosphatase CheX
MTTDLDITSLDLEEAAVYVLQGYPPALATPPAGSPDAVVAQIELLGESAAMMTIAASASAAASLAVAFFGTEVHDLMPDDLIDAVKELANVVGGAIKPLFGVTTTLSIPTIVVDEVEGRASRASASVPYASGTISLKLRSVA